MAVLDPAPPLVLRRESAAYAEFAEWHHRRVAGLQAAGSHYLHAETPTIPPLTGSWVNKIE